MKVGIDSSHGMRYTGMISGHSAKINYLYRDLLREFSKYGIKSLHWRKIPTKTRNRLRNFVVNLINNSDAIFHIFEHKRIKDLPARNVFHELLPQHISFKLSPWLREIEGECRIDVDDDYNTGSVTTETFIRKLVETINFQCTGQKIDARTTRKYNGVFLARSTIKTKKGSLEIYAYQTNSKFSNAIQIIDLVLGYFIENNAQFSRKKVFFWDIFKQ